MVIINKKRILILVLMVVGIVSLIAIQFANTPKKIQAVEADLEDDNTSEEVSSEEPCVKEESFIYTEEYLEEYFSDIDNADKVLRMPEGGFLSGPGEAVLSDADGNVLARYNVETDPNSETVAEAKQRLLREQPMKCE